MWILEIMSQFHYGSIQIPKAFRQVYLGNPSLNSTMVQFKSGKSKIRRVFFYFVSIPLWFNSNFLFSLKQKNPTEGVSIPLWFNSNVRKSPPSTL